MAAPSPQATAAAFIATALTPDQRLVARALADAGATRRRRHDRYGREPLLRPVPMRRLREAVNRRAGQPISERRVRIALYALGAGSTRYRGPSADRVRLVSPGRPLVVAQGGRGGTTHRTFALTILGADVVAELNQELIAA